MTQRKGTVADWAKAAAAFAGLVALGVALAYAIPLYLRLLWLAIQAGWSLIP